MNQAREIRKELGELGVRVIRIGTVFEQMLTTRNASSCEAGKPVEFVFENTDLMPHNLVIVSAGVARGDRPAGRGHGARTRAR